MNKLLLYSLSLFFLAETGKKIDSAQLFKTSNGLEKLHGNEYFIDDYKVHSVLHPNHNNHKNFKKDEIQTLCHAENESNMMAQEDVKEKSDVKTHAARFWVSKFAVHALAQIAYALAAGAASFVYPPAAPIVYCSLQLTFAPLVENASTMIASRTTTLDGASHRV